MKVLFFDLRESEKEFFKKNSFKDFEFTFFSEKLDKNTKLSDEQLQETDIISVYTSSILNQDILKNFKNLRIIATRSFRYNHIDVNYCAKNRIAVMNTEQYGDDAVAQYTLGLIIALMRNIKPAICGFTTNSPSLYEGQLLNNKVLGIIGCGNVGIKLAEIAKIFDMDVLVSSYKEALQLENFCTVVPFDELLSKSDIIALHMPFSDDNYQILGEEEFNKMKDGVVIINTSCVELISLHALYKNLQNGQYKRTGTDKEFDALLEKFYFQLNMRYSEDIFNDIYGETDSKDLYDEDQFEYYARWFKAIQANGGSCISISNTINVSKYDGFDGDAANDSDWLQSMIRAGKITVDHVDVNKKNGAVSFKSTSVPSDSVLEYTTTSTIDKTALAKAEAEYEHKTKEIDQKDKKFDLDLSKLDTQRQALKTEYESVKKVIQDNIDRTFGIFS